MYSIASLSLDYFSKLKYQYLLIYLLTLDEKKSDEVHCESSEHELLRMALPKDIRTGEAIKQPTE